MQTVAPALAPLRTPNPVKTPAPAPRNNATLRTFLREELSGWKRWEVAWFAFSCLTVLALSLYWGDTLMGIVSAVTGIAYTLCNGKGKRLAYVFGLVNSVLYAIISFGAGYYGETMLNGLYYAPMMIVGLVLWNRRMDSRTNEVQKRRMTARQRVLLCLGCAAGTVAYGFALQAMGDPLPFVDAFTTVTSVIALIVAIGRYMEQWVMWTAVNAVTIVMWAVAFAGGGESIATLVMWVVYLITGILMYVKWQRETAPESLC